MDCKLLQIISFKSIPAELSDGHNNSSDEKLTNELLFGKQPLFIRFCGMQHRHDEKNPHIP